MKQGFIKRAFLFFTLSLALQATGLHAEQTSSGQFSSDQGKSAEVTEGKVYVLPSIIVTANRRATPFREVASSVTVITAEEIEAAQQPQLLDLLRGLPGVDVTRQGGVGSITKVQLRGAKSNHTLVLIDGIEVSDASSTDGAYDFASLNTDNIERIEILRGPQGILYGSDAIGGVIEITTKKGSGTPQVSFSAEAGSHGTTVERVDLSGSRRKGTYSLSVWRHDTDGISVSNQKNGNSEKDGFSGTSISASLGLELFENGLLNINLKSIDALTDIDQFGKMGDDPNMVYDSRQLFARSGLSYSTQDKSFETRASVSLTKHDRENRDRPDANFATAVPFSNFVGSKLKFDFQASVAATSFDQITIGLEREREEFSGEAYGSVQPEVDSRTFGVYALNQLSLGDRVHFTVGGRLDDHDRFGSAWTYRVTAAWELGAFGARLRGTLGSGYKAPTLVQLFDATFGNIDLKPEESEGWDVGIEKFLWNDRISVEFTYFSNRFTELIGFDLNTYQSINTGKASSRGVETSLLLNSGPISSRIDVTYSRSENDLTNLPIIRLPKFKSRFSMNYRPTEAANANLGLTYTGRRYDTDFEDFADKILSSYLVVDLALSYAVWNQVRLTGRVENLFDEDYEEVITYGSLPRSIFLGIKTEL